MTITLGLLVSLICATVYLLNPDFIEHLQLKITDAIVSGAPQAGDSDTVVVVDIDEASLEAWGQWPWPRSQLSVLLNTIAGLGARCIALDFIMAEPDRTSPNTIRGELTTASSGRQDDPGPTTPPPDNDTILAQTLSSGPFILGYEFYFTDAHRRNADCHLHPLEIVNRRHLASGSGPLRFYQAQDTICNMAPLARAATRSGFLNGHPDSDGRLRRMPLVMGYKKAVYPSLALAALLPNANRQPATLEHGIDGQFFLTAQSHAIPVDDNGNLRIRFTANRSDLRHLSAQQILTGQIDESDINDRIVLVGLNASGLTPTYQTPGGGRFTAVEVHAQAIETILSKQFIRRHMGMHRLEAILSILATLLFSLAIARLEFVPTTIIGMAGIVGVWGGAQLLFNNRQILMSPLLPTALIITSGMCLMLFKYWTRQRKASQSMQDALILMKSTEKNLNAIINTIPDIVFRLDPTGRITFISPALAKYATQPGELIGKHILDLVVPDDRNMATYRINERRTGKRATADLELRLMLSPADGIPSEQERYFSVSAEGIYTHASPDSQSFVGTQGIARDIDNRKHLENQLEQSKKMEAMGSLAAGVAHDLNNILSGLVSYPELLLLDLPADSPMRAKIETIQRSGQRAADIVQDMLVIARRGVKNNAIINVSDAVTSYLETPEFRRLSEENPRMRLTTGLADDLMNIRGSMLHVLKIIMNLVGNATEAMPAGGTIHITTQNRYLDTTVECYESIPEGEYVVLSISDEGIGIPPQELQRIFEPFYSKKRMGRSGSGLGMTVVWNTLKDHAGYVDIHSKEGDGSCFDLFLPATREADTATERRIVLQDYTGTESILVVDDIPEQLDIAVRMLGKLGYQVVSASGGEEAIAYMRNHTVDLVVLDMVMPPGIDGLETYRRIVERHPGQKSIIASGYAPSNRVKAMQDAGAGEYIRKPYTMEKIGLAVRRELDRQP